MAQTLGEGEYLFPASELVMGNLMASIQSSFVDRAAGTYSFDDPAFTAYLDILQNVSAYTAPDAGEFQVTDYSTSAVPMYTVTDPELPDKLTDGTIALLPVSFSSPDVYGMIRLLYPENDGGLCGYPDTSAVISDLESMVIPANGNCPAGAKAFLAYLLSEEVQTSAMVLDYTGTAEPGEHVSGGISRRP